MSGGAKCGLLGTAALYTYFLNYPFKSTHCRCHDNHTVCNETRFKHIRIVIVSALNSLEYLHFRPQRITSTTTTGHIISFQKLQAGENTLENRGIREYGQRFLRARYKPVGQISSDNSRPQRVITTPTANTPHTKFDIEKSLTLFSQCRQSDDVILTDGYLNGYEELIKIFQLFGTIFSFVGADVEEKIAILRKYRQSDAGEKYETIQGMLRYEVDNKLPSTAAAASGARTLLRLHRAVEFISSLLVTIRDTEDNEVSSFSSEAVKAYDATLARHHPPLLRRVVRVAMSTSLPRRRLELLDMMGLEDTDENMALLSRLVEELSLIYGVTQEVYAQHHLLDLP